VNQSTGTPAGASGKTHEPYAWFRLHLKLAPHHGPLSLLIELPVSQNATFSSQTFDLDVFANGHHIRPEGPHGDEPARYQQISRIYNLNLSPTETSLVLVVRSIYVPWAMEPTPPSSPAVHCGWATAKTSATPWNFGPFIISSSVFRV